MTTLPNKRYNSYKAYIFFIRSEIELLGVLDLYTELGFVDQKKKAFVVGSDWGAVAGWYLSLFRPDRVLGLVALSVPYTPRNPTVKAVECIRQAIGDGSRVVQFQVCI